MRVYLCEGERECVSTCVREKGVYVRVYVLEGPCVCTYEGERHCMYVC